MPKTQKRTPSSSYTLLLKSAFLGFRVYLGAEYLSPKKVNRLKYNRFI